MKNKFAKRLINCGLLIAMVAMMAGQSAQAQSLGHGLRVNIPFDFSVGNKKLPAGKYSVTRPLSTGGDQLIEISRLDGKASIFRTTIPVTALRTRDKSTLVFHRYGDQYFLFQVWPAAASTGLTWPRSRSERELQQQTESMGLSQLQERESEVVTIVADLP